MRRPAWVGVRPARLAVLVLAGIIVLWVLAFNRHPTPPGGHVEAPSAASTTPTPTASPTTPLTAVQDGEGSVADATWYPLARRFLDRYLAGPGADRAAWQAAMVRDCTPTLANGLALADPGRLPTGALTHLTITTVDEMGGGTATATLSTGRALEVFVVRIAGRLAVADVQWSQ